MDRFTTRGLAPSIPLLLILYSVERKREREMHVFRIEYIFLMTIASVCFFRSLIMTIRTVAIFLDRGRRNSRPAALLRHTSERSLPFSRTLINKFEKQAFVLCPEESSIFSFRRAPRLLFASFSDVFCFSPAMRTFM